MSEKVNLFFMGAGPIAVPVLECVAAAPEFRLLGVATQPDRPAGRGRAAAPTPVGVAAQRLGLPTEKPLSVNTPEFRQSLRTAAPDLVLVVSFGQILKEDLLKLPMRFVNLHASLLPKYRGASPVAAAIRHRDERTGVAFMKMERGLDSGPVYRMFDYPLRGVETAGELELELGKLAAAHCPAVLPEIAAGRLAPTPQDEAAASVCRKLGKADGRLDWRRSAVELEALVRSCRPWPGAFFTATADGRELTVAVEEAKVRADLAGRPGEVLMADRHGWIVACGEEALELSRVGAPGKKVMAAKDFLNGFRNAAWQTK